MENKQMYMYMMLADMILTAVLEMWVQSGISEEEVTKEMWLEMSALHVQRRKDAMAEIRQRSAMAALDNLKP